MPISPAAVERDGAGQVTGIETDLSQGRKRSIRESLIHIHIQALETAEAREALKLALDKTLADVRAANADFLAMRTEVRQAAEGFRRKSQPYSKDDRKEAADFIDWLANDDFIFIGVRRYALAADGGLEVAEEGLGILRDRDVHELRLGEEAVVTTPEIRQFLAGPLPLIVTKASLRSRVHRRTFLDYVGVKLHADDGRLLGELRIIGLFTSTAYTD
ncbi:MAG: hypothetical protein B7Z41_07415, partial [Rhizobiales bacterium 12-66-7]